MNSHRLFQAIYISICKLVMVTPFSLLAMMVSDPDKNPRKGARKGVPAPLTERERQAAILHGEIQRSFSGTKKTNVGHYAKYIEALINGEIAGDTPEIVLWTPNQLVVTQNPQNIEIATVAIPENEGIIAIDGDTQLAARYRLLGQGIGAAERVVVTLLHGIQPGAARQIFHDRQMLGVNISPAFAMTKDSRNPLTSFANELRAVIPELITMNSADPAKIPYSFLHQALLWSSIHSVNQLRRVPPDYLERLEQAKAHLVRRLGLLRPLLAQALLRRPSLFLAATDASVSVEVLAQTDWSDSEWKAFKTQATRPTIDAIVKKLNRETLDLGLPEPEQATMH